MDKEEILQKLAEERPAFWSKIIYNILRQNDIVDDVLQESWKRLLASRVNLESYGDWERYFRKIVINTALDYRKLQGTSIKRSAPIEAILEMPDQKEDPLKEVIAEENREVGKRILDDVNSLIAKLPAGQQDAICWILLEEEPMTLEQLSLQKGIPISTLKSRLISGLKKIQKNLRKKDAP